MASILPARDASMSGSGTIETPIAVMCDAEADGWRCTVTLGDDPAATEHEVRVDRDALARLAPGAEPDDLVRESFRFLLAREARTSIMRSFDLPIIGRFFGDFEAEIRRRMTPSEG